MAGWTRTELAGKAADVFEPGSPARFALIYLHGVGQEVLSEKPVVTEQLEELGLACVAPRGDVSWWSDRIWPGFDAHLTAERFVVDRLRPAVLDRFGLGPRGIGLFGISMGGQGALRIAFRRSEEFPVVAGIAPAVDYHEWYGQNTSIDSMYDSKEQCRQDTALMHIHPVHQPPHVYFCCDPTDPWHRGNDRMHEKLKALGVSHSCDLTTAAGGHTWDYYGHVMPQVLRFLRDGLETQSRRLL